MGNLMALHSSEAADSPAAGLIRPFMPELDTLRGIAVIGVVLLHGFSWQYSGMSFSPWARRFMAATQPGWMGVNLFFVLSGFLITGILLDSKTRPNFYRRFYTRRALRILPAYYTLLIVLLLLRSGSTAFVGLSFVYLANVTNFFGVACDYGPLWSLAVEEHFYIAWPTVVRRLTMRRLAWVSAAIVVLVPVLRAISFSLGWRDGLDWYRGLLPMGWRPEACWPSFCEFPSRGDRSRGSAVCCSVRRSWWGLPGNHSESLQEAGYSVRGCS
jgi:peptidoglycan/LPS O-acetylase OafA/YrhL